MYCKNCGNKLNQDNKFCSNCGIENSKKNMGMNVKVNQNSKYSLLNTLSFINVIIMVFYTFSKEASNLGVLLAFMIGPFLMLPQAILVLLSSFKKSNFILNIILIIGGLISTIVTISMFNYNINIFIIMNILLLIIVFVNLLKK